MRTIAYATVCISMCAATLVAQNPNNEQISPTVNISYNGTNVSSTGTLQYFANGFGHCTGYHNIYATSGGGGTLVQNDFSQVTSYNQTISGNGSYSTCYRATVYAAGVFGTQQQVTSGQVCTPADPQGGDGCGTNGGLCEQSESCPLILDLNGDGIMTTGLDDPVHFWIDLNGQPETTAWTNPATEEAFLWTDLNHDHVAQVTELFGSRMIAYHGGYHANGFEALEKYDRPWYGGNGDGQITHKDELWSRLKLWVDRNHDGVSQPTEISVLSAHRIVALNLAYVEGDTYDENGNEMYIIGSYVVRNHGNDTQLRLMADVEFRYIAN